MRTRLAGTSLFLVLLVFCFLSSFATAADVMLNATVESTVVGFDKNGDQYVRIIIQEKRSLQGVNYEVGVPVMAFSENLEAAKKLSKGDTLKAICQTREFQGRKSYTILKIL